MSTHNGLIRVAAISAMALIPAVLLHSESVMLKLALQSTYEQTDVYRANVIFSGFVIIRSVTVLDSAMGGGSDGIYSGSDIDCVLFDVDGNPETTDDQYAPLESAATSIDPGDVRNRSGSSFQPTSVCPGPLFGTDNAGLIIFDVATLDVLDSRYSNLSSPDSSHGWVSLGDSGSLTLAFEPIALDSCETLYLIIGEAGPGSGETLTAVLNGD